MMIFKVFSYLSTTEMSMNTTEISPLPEVYFQLFYRLPSEHKISSLATLWHTALRRGKHDMSPYRESISVWILEYYIINFLFLFLKVSCPTLTEHPSFQRGHEVEVAILSFHYELAYTFLLCLLCLLPLKDVNSHTPLERNSGKQQNIWVK